MGSNPTQPGWYWYRNRTKSLGWYVIEVAHERSTQRLIAGLAGHEHWILIEDLPGEFGGPIDPPGE